MDFPFNLLSYDDVLEVDHRGTEGMENCAACDFRKD